MSAVYASISAALPMDTAFPEDNSSRVSEGLIIMRNRMTTRTRRLLVTGGIATVAGLYVTIATMDGANWRPFTEDIEQTAISAKDGFTDWAGGVLHWALETEINPATIFIMFVAWLSLAAIARRANRAWGLTGHAAKALKSNSSKATGMWSGIALGIVLLLGALGIGTAYAGVALGENFKPEVVAASDWSKKTIEGWFDNEEPKAAPASSAAPTGTTGDEPVETASPAPAQPEEERTEEPKDRTDATTGDKRTEPPADTRTDASDDKPVTDAFEGVLSHGDRIVNDPVKWMDENPLKALGLGLFLLMWMLWSLLKWRQNMLMRRELVSLRGRVNTHGNYLKDDDRRLTELESKKLRRGNGPDTLVAGSPTTD